MEPSCSASSSSSSCAAPLVGADPSSKESVSSATAAAAAAAVAVAQPVRGKRRSNSVVEGTTKAQATKRAKTTHKTKPKRNHKHKKSQASASDDYARRLLRKYVPYLVMDSSCVEYGLESTTYDATYANRLRYSSATYPSSLPSFQRVKTPRYKARLRYIDSLWPTPRTNDLEHEDWDQDQDQGYGHEYLNEEEEEENQEDLESCLQDHYSVEVMIVPEDQAEKKQTSDLEHQMVQNAIKRDETTGHKEGDEENGKDKNKDQAQQPKPTEEPITLVSKQDDWVQCDKCQKWRRLPNYVNVDELPATWYCKMNRWDKRFNKCSVPEEKILIPLKESDLKVFRERRFAADFVRRLKRMEKLLHQFKYVDPKEDDGMRKMLQCDVCLKKRPLLGGMDPSRWPQPFVCWMNSWDELHASCSASANRFYTRQETQGVVPHANRELANQAAASNSAANAINWASGTTSHGAYNHSSNATADATGSAVTASRKKQNHPNSRNTGNTNKRRVSGSTGGQQDRDRDTKSKSSSTNTSKQSRHAHKDKEKKP